MIAIGCDHGGYELKQEVLKHLEERGIEYKDYGCYSPESVDYSDIAKVVCDAVVAGEAERAFLICGTGIGMSMAANKIKGIRQPAAPTPSARSSRVCTMTPTSCASAAVSSAPAWHCSSSTRSSTTSSRADATSAASTKSWHLRTNKL